MMKIREVEDKDLIHLAEFLPKGFPYTTKEFWLPLFKLWWSSNPAYTDQFPRGWILENGSSIYGFIGNIPVKFLIRGQVKIAAACNSWYVDPKSQGIFSFTLFNEYLKQKDAFLFLFKGEYNENIMKILSKYKFEEYILPKSQKEYVYIIDKKNVNSIFKTFLVNNQIPQLSQLLEYYKRIGFLLLAYLHQKPIICGGDPPMETYVSSLCTSCDDSFSHLWAQSLNTCDATLSRDLKTLNWLYFSSARIHKRLVIQCRRSRNNTLAGYMVFDIIQKATLENESIQLVDMCIEKNETQVLESLISFAIEQGKQNNASLLILWATNPEIEKFFQSKIPMRRTARHYRYIRFRDAPGMQSDSGVYDNVCLPMIYPPQ